MRFVYPTGPAHIPVYVVIKEIEGAQVVRCFSSYPPANVIEETDGEITVLETCLDMLDASEEQ